MPDICRIIAFDRKIWVMDTRDVNNPFWVLNKLRHPSGC